MLSEEARGRETSLIDRKRLALAEFAERYFDPRVGKAAQRQAELFRPIEEAILAAIRDVAEREGFDLVLDASGGAVLWGAGKYDLTDEVDKVLTAISLEVKTEIRFIPNDKRLVKPDIKAAVKVKGTGSTKKKKRKMI